MSDKRYLVEQLSWYGAYHSVFGNQLVHFIFIPILLVTSLALFNISISITSSKLYEFNDTFIDTYFPINVCLLLWTVMYPLSYLYIDFFGGLTWIPFAFLVWFTTNYIIHHFTVQSIVIVFAISWIAQFLSHALIEKRKPALIDSLYSSLVLAPFFWWFEVVLFNIGIYSSLQTQMTHNAKRIQHELDATAHQD